MLFTFTPRQSIQCKKDYASVRVLVVMIANAVLPLPAFAFGRRH